MIDASKIARNVDTAIDVAYRQYPRVYLGLSSLGEPCPRKAFLQWRFAKQKVWSPRMVRLLDRGQREEERVVDWLRLANYRVLEKDPKTKRQFEYIRQHGHVKGHCDGLVYINGDWYILEIKTHNHRSWTQVKRANNIQNAKPVHFCQCQSYMECERVKGSLYVAVNKDNDSIHWEIVNYDRATVSWLNERELALLEAQAIPERIVEEPGFWLCNMCDFKSVCFHDEPVDQTCRLCTHVRLGKEGTWKCRKRKIKSLSLNVQLTGCPKFVCI